MNLRSAICVSLLLLPGVVKTQPDFVLDSIIRYDYLGGDTVASIKNIFLHNETGLVIEETVQNRTLTGIEWNNQSRTTTSYHGSLPDTLTSWTYETEIWLPVSRTIHDYDDRNEIAQVVNQEWDRDFETWSNKSLVLRGITISGCPYRKQATWSPQLNGWEAVDSTISVLNEHPGIQSDTTYLWISFAGIYLYSSLVLYEYDSVENLITQARYRYDLDSLEFLPRSRDTFGYDHKRFQVLSRFDTWNQQMKTWDPSLMIERSSNSNGYLEESRISFVDFLSGQLIPSSRLEYSYTDGSNRDLADSLVHSVKNFIYIGNIEIPDWKTHYFYSPSEVTPERNFTGKDLISIFPNPASDFVLLYGNLTDIKYARWITVDGKIISDFKISGDRIRVPVVSDYPSSLYLILADQDGRPLQITKILVTTR